jgi:two-component system, LytTR family, sensor histidine kinase AlgZ
MHPILSRLDRLALYLTAWLVIGLLIAGTIERSGLSFAETAVFILPVFLVYSFVCLSAWYVCGAVPLRTNGAVRVLFVCTVAAVVASGLWLALAFSWIFVFESIPRLASLATRYRELIPLLFPAAVLLFGLALTVNYLGMAFEEARQAEQRQFEFEMQARDAELRALRAQLDPHFLYNCLNSIAALTATDAAGARRMCLLLGDFLRSTLHVGAHASIPLADELALADRFLAIEQVRFGPRLQVERHVETAALAAQVPPLFLQPLFENAVRHGISALLDGGTVRVTAGRRDDRLAICIENPCDPDQLTPMRQGTGMSNVRQRMVTMFGASAVMQARAEHGCFRVELSLPFTDQG